MSINGSRPLSDDLPAYIADHAQTIADHAQHIDAKHESLVALASLSSAVGDDALTNMSRLAAAHDSGYQEGALRLSAAALVGLVAEDASVNGEEIFRAYIQGAAQGRKPRVLSGTSLPRAMVGVELTSAFPDLLGRGENDVARRLLAAGRDAEALRFVDEFDVFTARAIHAVSRRIPTRRINRAK